MAYESSDEEMEEIVDSSNEETEAADDESIKTESIEIRPKNREMANPQKLEKNQDDDFLKNGNSREKTIEGKHQNHYKGLNE